MRLGGWDRDDGPYGGERTEAVILRPESFVQAVSLRTQGRWE